MKKNYDNLIIYIKQLNSMDIVTASVITKPDDSGTPNKQDDEGFEDR